jgi:hypothetical protein
MEQLRECGIYEAPNGRKLVASRFRRTTSDGRRILSSIGSNISYFLFSQYQWAFHGEPEFEVGPRGELMSTVLSAEWSIEELIDTGITAGYH